MRYEIEAHEGATLLVIRGPIEIGSGDVKLREILQEIKQSGETSVILDLARVTHIDSSGMGELIANYTDLTRAGIRVVLSRLNTRIYDLMQITHLVTVFPIYDSNEDAMQHLARAA